MKNKRRINKAGGIADRFIGMLASLLFSVPTAFVLWLFANIELAQTTSDDVFLNSSVLWTLIAVFAVIAFLLPNFFTNLMGRIWDAMAWVGKWFGW